MFIYASNLTGRPPSLKAPYKDVVGPRTVYVQKII